MVRRLFLCTLLVFVCTALSAQSIEKRYRSYLTSTGMLHFIGRKKLTKTENLSKFEYDITYIAGEDSATVNFSFVTDSPTLVKNCSVINNVDTVLIQNPRMMFRDILQKGYRIRTTTKIAFAKLRGFYNNATPFVFSMELENGVRCSASFTSSQWQRERMDIQRVFESIVSK